MVTVVRADAGATLGRRSRSAVSSWLFVLLLLLITPFPACAVEPGDLTLTVTPDFTGNAPPYAREMVLLRLRGTYVAQILLETVQQPSLANVSWTQLGRDTWGREPMPDGRMALTFERTIAIFPQHAGSFTIAPFTHHLTINDNGERRVVDVHSVDIPVPVASWPDPTGGPDAAEPWWLPAREVTITDAWEPDPETINLGETTRRVVTLEAQGMLAEGLPPRPVMRSRGIITFAGPVKRETIITPHGPVARATYQWDIKKGVPEVIPLEAVRIPWFDTLSRTMREAEIPARQIGGGLPDREEDLKPPALASWPTLAVAGLAAFGLGLALIGFGPARGRPGLPRRDRRDLSRAVRGNDAVAFRIVVARATQRRPELAARWRADPDTASGLMALDRHVYGRGGAGEPDLGRLAKLLRRPRPQAVGVVAPAPSLAPLDGPVR